MVCYNSLFMHLHMQHIIIQNYIYAMIIFSTTYSCYYQTTGHFTEHLHLQILAPRLIIPFNVLSEIIRYIVLLLHFTSKEAE